MSIQTAKSDYAYCAGIIDGEGCIRIIKSKNDDRKAGFEWQLDIAVSNTSQRILNKLVGVFGGHIYSREKCEANYKCFVWHLYGKKACEALKKMKPYLTEKKEQADLGIHFNVHISQRIMKKATRNLTPKEIELRNRYYWRMRELKKEFLVPVSPIALAETERGNTLITGEATVQAN